LERLRRFPGCRIAVVARTAGSLWGEVVEGQSGLLGCSPPWFEPKVQTNKRRLLFPNGSKAILFTGEEPDNLRGPNNHFGVIDELAAMPYAEEVWRQLQMTMRSGVHPQTMVATTPRPLKLLIRLTQDSRSAVTVGASYENRANVAQSWLDENLKVYEGTAFGRQEIGGEILEEMPGALFKREWFERPWCRDAQKESPFRRIGIGVDPAETSGEKADNWGIIAAGQREEGYKGETQDFLHVLLLGSGGWWLNGMALVQTFYPEPPFCWSIRDGRVNVEPPGRPASPSDPAAGPARDRKGCSARSR